MAATLPLESQRERGRTAEFTAKFTVSVYLKGRPVIALDAIRGGEGLAAETTSRHGAWLRGRAVRESLQSP